MHYYSIYVIYSHYQLNEDDLFAIRFPIIWYPRLPVLYFFIVCGCLFLNLILVLCVSSAWRHYQGQNLTFGLWKVIVFCNYNQSMLLDVEETEQGTCHSVSCTLFYKIYIYHTSICIHLSVFYKTYYIQHIIFSIFSTFFISIFVVNDIKK